MHTKFHIKALTFSLVMIMVLLGSCAPAKPTETQAPVETQSSAVTEVPTTAVDNRPDIIIAVPYLNETHDPTDNYNIEVPILTNIYDNLIFRDFGQTGSGSAPIAGLAESWSQLSPTEWQINLRHEVKFHDGTEMTSADVVFTLFSPDRLNIDWAQMGQAFSNVEAVDTYTVKVTTKFPDPAFVSRLQTYIGQVVPMNYYNEVGEDQFGIEPVGTGPYKMTEFVPLDHVTLTAFDEYWGGKPPIKTITFKAVPELSSRIAGLLKGEYDIALGIPPDQFEVVEAAQGIKVVGSIVDNFTALAFQTNHDGKPEANETFRQAMVYAIDRNLLTQTLWKGLTTPPLGYQFPAYGDYYNPDFKGITYDLDKAKSLLTESGYNGEEILVQYLKGYFPVYDQAMEVMQQMWKDAGINVKMEPLESWTLFKYDTAALTSTSFSADITDPDNLLKYYSADSWNVTSGISKPSAEETALAQTLQTSMDFATRKDAFQQLLKIFDTKCIILPIWYQYYAYGMKDSIQMIPYSNFGLDFRADKITFAP